MDRSGDINGDGEVTITDANIIYQMQRDRNYYDAIGNGQPTVLQRLMADYQTDTGSAQYRGSVNDAVDLLNRINGQTGQ